ncbi:unnamed protein product, partial [Phaeothamnion confervicola]
YATSNFQPVLELLNFLHDAERIADWSAEIEQLATRFVGNGQKTLAAAELFFKRGEDQDAMKVLAQQIDTGAPQWPVYMKLGTAHLEQGQYEQALATYLKYPSFAGDGAAADIDIDNAVNEAGSKFFWRGMEKPAREIFARGANTSSGSDGDMAANI